ncbi:amino acid adenylation domain-containing protein [Streptomyces olivaceus]|uniref:non-ribosomal peptide synthetase n=1 Tax=Streptomyces olivaceus TaxID=47716 RepID=UPI0037F3686E
MSLRARESRSAIPCPRPDAPRRHRHPPSPRPTRRQTADAYPTRRVPSAGKRRARLTPPVTEAFVAQARRRPDAIAVTDGRAHVTYAELLRAASGIAASLSARQGPSRTPVGICLGRSPRLIASVLATLLSGRAYVPLDSSYPTSRLHHMIGDSGISVVLCEERTYEAVADRPASGKLVEWIRLDTEDEAAEHDATSSEDSAVSLGPDDSAYVLYTSGSTGLPKGVAMSHGPLARLIDWHQRTDEPQVGLVTAQFAPISFDVSFQEIFSTLCAGGTLLLVDEETRRDPDALLTLMSEQGVTRLFLPASALHQIALHAATGSSRLQLRNIVCAGEQLQVTRAVKEWLSTMPGCRLHNHYGPTETHVVTAHTLDGSPGTWPDLPPIGRPLPHVRTLLLDDQGRPIPDGAPGELYLGGSCLADGYLGRPDLTAERFRFLVDSGRFYRTGDIVRRRPDDTLEYLGRADNQVKVRGHRVETGEVELALIAHPDIAESCVVTLPDRAGQKQLVAYVVPAPGAPEYGAPEPITLRFVPKWHRHLGHSLPDFMVPPTFVVVDRLPLTPSGKVNRAALPVPHTTRPALATPFVPPSTATEEQVAEVWREALQLDQVGVDDNFFDLGGNSLLVVYAHTLLIQATDQRFPLVDLFEHPSVRSLAARIDERNAPKADAERPTSTWPSRRQRVIRRRPAATRKDTTR